MFERNSLSTIDIFVATSIVPNHREKIQFQATKSWIKSNLNILSLNPHNELNDLRKKYPHINFIENNRTGKLIAQKPVVFISDLLHSLRLTKAETLGIVNSDIINSGSDDFFNEIVNLSKRGLVYGPRIDISSIDDTNGVIDPFGFDFFFFDRSFIDTWNESQFCLGMPFWDHWFPLVALLKEKNIIKLLCNNFHHVVHPTDRDSSFFLFNDHFVQELIPYFKNNSVGFGSEFDFSPYWELKSKALNKHGKNYNENLVKFYDKLSKYVLNFLEANSQIIRM
tara:strand:- start:141 stop:983 length:843 start_codon:yes stop_codon:yes gene_type:complete